ncbi:MAG: hypothetical protein ABR599_12515 [Gemmatimonadota bacterium]
MKKTKYGRSLLFVCLLSALGAIAVSCTREDEAAVPLAPTAIDERGERGESPSGSHGLSNN